MTWSWTTAQMYISQLTAMSAALPARVRSVRGRARTARAPAQRPRTVTSAAAATRPQAVRWATTSSAGTPASIFQ